MFESVQFRPEGKMFSESLVEEAKIVALEMLRRNELEREIPAGKSGSLLLTTDKSSGSVLFTFPMDGAIFYIVLPSEK